MTPKEKALALIHRFDTVDHLKDFEGMDETLSKQCALVCVDEIIKNINENHCGVNYDWWYYVRQEIEKL